jgi:hypothetical protein
MRKQILRPTPTATPEGERPWLNLEHIARVEISSEDSAFPIESIFTHEGSGWRAARMDQQTIRVMLDQLQHITRIWLRFVETTTARTQEFTIRWIPDGELSSKEIVRQRWNFSPDGSTVEIEDYAVDLREASVLELTIDPDLGRNRSVATVAKWRVA